MCHWNRSGLLIISEHRFKKMGSGLTSDIWFHQYLLHFPWYFKNGFPYKVDLQQSCASPLSHIVVDNKQNRSLKNISDFFSDRFFSQYLNRITAGKNIGFFHCLLSFAYSVFIDVKEVVKISFSVPNLLLNRPSLFNPCRNLSPLLVHPPP